jgi:hypothetical protein
MSPTIKVALLLGCFALASCATTAVPIHQVRDAAVITASGKPVSAAQVRQAIITAGTSLGWRIADAGPSRLEGTLSLRAHTAVVDIPYSASAYSITLKRADNLLHADDRIHRNYNGWVQNLDRATRTELSRF